MKTVAERIKEARLAKGLSQGELAALCEISDSAVQMYEIGQRVPRDSVKVKLAEVLGVPVQDLFF
ncbi:MAG: helix-turn-helix transcriptional regulator [Kiritimatiellae bacterium]|nr:helix-turn-helix transcriptional regulator [Kiritimatiellia bacterium]